MDRGSERPLPEESRVVRSPNFEDFPAGLGYVQDTVKNKGIFVAQQLPIPSENSQLEFVKDEDDSGRVGEGIWN